MCVHNHIMFIILCYYCVPIAVYHHEPSRRALIELGIKIKLLIATTTQSHSMHVCVVHNKYNIEPENLGGPLVVNP